MDSSLLKVFVAVCERGSISLGAQDLGYTQSNVTLRIKQLEKVLGFPVFHRVPKGVTLTYEGTKLIPYAKEIVEKVEIASLQMKNINEQELLRIGTSQANATIRLLPFIEKLTTKFPTMDLELYADGTPQVVEKLLDYKVDIAFIMGKPDVKEITVLNSFDDAPYLVEAKNKKSKNCLIGYRQRSTHFDYLKKYEEGIGNSDYTTMIMENYEVMLGCVNLGMGKAFLSKHIVEKFGYLDDLKLTKVPGISEQLNTYLICRKDYVPKISEYLKKMRLQ